MGKMVRTGLMGMMLCGFLLFMTESQVSAAVVTPAGGAHIIYVNNEAMFLEAWVDGTNGWIHLREENVTIGRSCLVQLHLSTGAVLPYSCAGFGGQDCYVPISLLGLPEGVHEAAIFDMSDRGNRYLLTVQLSVAGGVCEFRSSNAYSEQVFLNSLNAYYRPKNYDGKSYYACKAKNYSAISSFAKQLTADCATDEQKVRRIHDWIASNISYDKESVANGNVTVACDAARTFESGRGVCGGISRLAEIMITAAGVPCMNILGYTSLDLVEGYDYTKVNHGWNAAFYDGEWHLLDITNDGANKYYGQDDCRNVFGQMPKYVCYDMNAFASGNYHISVEVDPLSRDYGK